MFNVEESILNLQQNVNGRSCVIFEGYQTLMINQSWAILIYNMIIMVIILCYNGFSMKLYPNKDNYNSFEASDAIDDCIYDWGSIFIPQNKSSVF